MPQKWREEKFFPPFDSLLSEVYSRSGLYAKKPWNLSQAGDLVVCQAAVKAEAVVDEGGHGHAGAVGRSDPQGGVLDHQALFFRGV